MDSKTKLFVFAKKEVFLIFVFMILMSVTFFVLGVRIGKNYSMEISGITKSDEKKVVDLLSKTEEDFSKIKEVEKVPHIDNGEIEKKLQAKINEEFGNVNKNTSSEHAEVMKNEIPEKGDALSGKFTILLGSHRSLKEAEEFAEGFKARGYDPIINQVEIKGKGTWYRVSLGAFLNNEEAKAYVIKEKSLFIGQDYSIVKMP